MYCQYFGLREAPFSIAPNPRYLFMTESHREALAHLHYGVGVGGGFVLLTGEVGTGKTTVSRLLLEQFSLDTDVAFILNPSLNAPELLASICEELFIEDIDDKKSLKSLSDGLYRFLLENHAKGRNTVLLIDEAQHLQFDMLEQIRLLTNLETNTKKLLQIIFVGQPELKQLLAEPKLRQLSQRITARFHIKSLNLNETQAYIQHRLKVAGLAADRQLFGPRVVKEIYRISNGIPRMINIICDRAMLGTYTQKKSVTDLATLRQAASDVMGEDVRQGYLTGRLVLALLVSAAVITGLLVAGTLLWQGPVQFNSEPKLSSSHSQTGAPRAISATLGSPSRNFIDEVALGDRVKINDWLAVKFAYLDGGNTRLPIEVLSSSLAHGVKLFQIDLHRNSMPKSLSGKG